MLDRLQKVLDGSDTPPQIQSEIMGMAEAVKFASDNIYCAEGLGLVNGYIEMAGSALDSALQNLFSAIEREVPSE